MTTEDEATRLLKSADPARVDDDAPIVDAAGFLAALRTRSTTVTLIDPEPTPTQPESHHRWPIIAGAAAAVVAIVVGALVVATRTERIEIVPAAAPTTVPQPTTTVVQPAAVAQPPVEFTACAYPGPEVTHGTDEQIEVAVPDGEMTIEQSRGYTWRLQVSDVSDPRLEGTWYTSWDVDQYVGPGDDPGPAFITITDRIENDEGAWQGSAVRLEFPDDDSPRFPLQVLIGEGAYEGLTAVVQADDSVTDPSGPCPNNRGYIIEGSVPTPPVPQTGE